MKRGTSWRRSSLSPIDARRDCVGPYVLTDAHEHCARPEYVRLWGTDLRRATHLTLLTSPAAPTKSRHLHYWPRASMSSGTT